MNLRAKAIIKSELKVLILLAFLACVLFYTNSCSATKMEKNQAEDTQLIISNLENGRSDDFLRIQREFSKSNPGYQLNYFKDVVALASSESKRSVFIQKGGGSATINGNTSKFSVGDILLLRAGDQVATDSMFSALAITVPDEIPSSLPTFIRPDWDENITDTPGGCATETNAYRRILLTWKETVGPYVFHSVNAHRVRIMDSFSHYHPREGGFDEFYLVQMAAPTARLITSTRVDQIENNETLTTESAAVLTESHELKVNDLVYIPRGLMHRGVGNVLAQVITVPGFIPGAEIGVDHHLAKINSRFNFMSGKALPYNVDASKKAVVK